MPSGSIFTGLIWGACVGILLPYLSTNLDTLMTAIEADILALDPILLAAAGFAAISVFCVGVLLLVGLFSGNRRKDFLSTVVGFVLGAAIAPFALVFARDNGIIIPLLTPEGPLLPTEAAPVNQ